MAKILDQWAPGNDYSMFIFQGGDLYRILQERYKRMYERQLKEFTIYGPMEILIPIIMTIYEEGSLKHVGL